MYRIPKKNRRRSEGRLLVQNVSRITKYYVTRLPKNKEEIQIVDDVKMENSRRRCQRTGHAANIHARCQTIALSFLMPVR